MQRIRVLVVDDHRIFAESLAAALAAEHDVEVTAAGSAQAAKRHLARASAAGRPFGVLLMDVDLGRNAPDATTTTISANGTTNTVRTAGATSAHGTGTQLVPDLLREWPELRTVMLAERDDPQLAASALQAGACGWVAKDCSLSRLLQVLRGVLRGETHLPPALLTGVLRELTTTRKHRTESEQLVSALTPREQEVLRCMVAGLGRKAVAEKLFLSPHTVRTHMQNVLGKLGVHSTLAAVALARRAGVVPVGTEHAPL